MVVAATVGVADEVVIPTDLVHGRYPVEDGRHQLLGLLLAQEDRTALGARQVARRLDDLAQQQPDVACAQRKSRDEDGLRRAILLHVRFDTFLLDRACNSVLTVLVRPFTKKEF